MPLFKCVAGDVTQARQDCRSGLEEAWQSDLRAGLA